MPLGAARFGLLGGVADLGKLELIETQTVTTSVASVDFTSIGSYNVHFLTYNNVQCTVDGKSLALQFSVGGTFQTSGYQYAYQYGIDSGTFGESRTTSSSSLYIAFQTGTAGNEKQNGYSYLYNLTDSSKYSFQTMHSMGRRNVPDSLFGFGSGVYTTANQVDGIRIIPEATSNLDTGVFSIYGIAES